MKRLHAVLLMAEFVGTWFLLLSITALVWILIGVWAIQFIRWAF